MKSEQTIGSGAHWAKLKAEARDANTVMRIHALSLLCFADQIDEEIQEALAKGGHLSYTIQVSTPQERPAHE